MVDVCARFSSSFDSARHCRFHQDASRWFCLFCLKIPLLQLFYLVIQCQVLKQHSFLGCLPIPTTVINVNVQFLKLAQQANFIHFDSLTLNWRMSETWCIVCLEITKLLQKTANLHNDSKDIFLSRVIMHRKSFDCFIILDNWVEALFLQFLPVTTQVVLVIGIEKQQKILNVAYIFL